MYFDGEIPDYRLIGTLMQLIQLPNPEKTIAINFYNDIKNMQFY